MHNNYKKFIKKFIKHDKSVIEPFIASHFSIIANFVRKSGGNEQDAEDLMQDALYVFYKLLKSKKKIMMKKDIDEYFGGIYRNIWYKKLNNKEKSKQILKYNSIDENTMNSLLIDRDTIEEIKREGRYKLYRKHLLKAEENCYKIFKMIKLSISNKDMAKIMNCSLAYLNKMKTKCKKKLIESIKNDPDYTD